MNNEQGISNIEVIQPLLHLPAGKGRFIILCSIFDIFIAHLNDITQKGIRQE